MTGAVTGARWRVPAFDDPFTLRPATSTDVAAIAGLFARVRAAKLPYLPKLHTAGDDLHHFGEHVMPGSAVWVAESGSHVLGFIAFRAGWVDHLYGEIGRDRGGIGSALLGKAMEAEASLQLWAFQRNTPAIEFYRRKGFVIVEETDGTGNEEREPDVCLAWTRARQSPPA